MFMMQILTQTHNHTFRKNVATDKKNILKKRVLKFQSPHFNILQISILEQKWLNKII